MIYHYREAYKVLIEPTTRRTKAAKFVRNITHSQLLGQQAPLEMSEKVESVGADGTPIVSEAVHQAIDEKHGKDALDTEITPVSAVDDSDSQDKDDGSEDVIIISGEDAALHLLPLRDDFQPALTFRSLLLATILSAFQAVMYQIYSVSSNSTVL